MNDYEYDTIPEASHSGDLSCGYGCHEALPFVMRWGGRPVPIEYCSRCGRMAGITWDTYHALGGTKQPPREAQP